MQAGPLRHREDIQYYRIPESQDSVGQPIPGWTDFAVSVPAEIKTLSGNELIAAQETFAEARVQVRIRYLAGVTELMRIVFENSYYDIGFIDDVNKRHVEMVLLCKTGLTEG